MIKSRTRSRHDDTVDSANRPFLITDAPRTYQDEFNERRRRYSLIMSMRIPCLILAALLYQVSPWLAGAIIMLSVPLPWIAVLIANDRLPLKHSKFRPHRHAHTKIGPTDPANTPPCRAAATSTTIDVIP
jgi:Protein of unknown function (DUF3099)